MEGLKILVVDDEARMRKLVKDFLSIKGFRVIEAGDGEEALEAFFAQKDIALILLDVMMPKMDGWQVVKTIRQYSKVPIIMLTARGEERDELQGFELGVDEYISKPFSPKILTARVEAILRRTGNTSVDAVNVGGIVIDKAARQVTIDGQPIELSYKEFELLIYFVDNQGMALSREKILNNVWNYDYFGDARTIDTHVKKLRSKLGEKGEYIKTVWGMGYKFEVRQCIYTLAPNAYNPNIKWETTETYNVGLDFGIFGGRINGNIDAYLRKTYDLLNDINTPMGSNFSNKVISNVGDMKNMGLEFNLNFIPIEKKDMRWTINVNGTWQKTEITKLTNTGDDDYLGVQVGAGMSSIGGYTSLYRVGYTPYTYYLFQQAYDENGKAIENTLVDRNGDGQITEDDRYVTGKSILPKFFFGIGSQFTYKKWDFGFNAHGSLGGYALNKVAKNNSTSYSDDHSKGYINNLSTYCLKTGWTEALTEYQQVSDMFLENASFFRLDDINVGYTFDKFAHWNGKIRVGASVQNVFTITKYSGLDPELTAADGVDNNLIPRPRLYTVRLNINF